MNVNSLKKFILPPGPIISLTLIGLMLLSALLYYRAVKVQRFLEPVLSLSQPRIEFSKNIHQMLLTEFGEGKIQGVRFFANSFFVDEMLILSEPHHQEKFGYLVLDKLGKIFLGILEDPEMRFHVDLILVITELPYSRYLEMDKRRRVDQQSKSIFILDSLYKAEPKLAIEYGRYFAATVIPASPVQRERNWIEFRIITSERLHIKMIKRLGKHLR